MTAAPRPASAMVAHLLFPVRCIECKGVECFTCGARAGEPCRTLADQPMALKHLARLAKEGLWAP